MSGLGVTRTPWTEADDEALHELRPTCTTKQMAEYMGRTVTSVESRLQVLRRKGLDLPRVNTGPGRSLPYMLPRTATLLAKTCVECGQLRDGQHYRQHVSGAYEAACKLCCNERKRGKNRYGPAHQNAELLQEITFAQASNENQRYTEDELISVKDSTVSEFDVALKLSRSYYAICSKRSKMGVGPWGSAAKRLGTPNSQWEIDFPAALVALQEHFHELGLPVPESLWEWTDESEAVA